MENTENRIGFISFLQFIGVLSVIFGHAMNSIPVLTILTDIKAWVYTWHMPLFFFVSAFLFSYKGGYSQGHKNVILKRFYRLIVPYLIWNLIFLLPKYFLGYAYDSPVEFSMSYFIKIIFRPRDNILGHTWFLCALFEMFIIGIILDIAKKWKELWIPILLGFVVINCFTVWNRWLALDDLMKNGVFFWCGMLIGTYSPDKIANYLKKKKSYVSTILVVAFTTVIWIFNPDMKINTLVLGFSVLVFFMSLHVFSGIQHRIIEFVSKNSFPIYIMHWPVIMVSRLVFYQKMCLSPIICFIINDVFGFIIPCGLTIILRKVKNPFIRKIATVVFGL